MPQPIPQPPGVPLLGNIFDINPEKTWQSLAALAQQHGEIFRISVLGHSVVFIAGVELAGEVCDEKRFRKHVGGPIVEVRAAVNDALFTAYHDEDIWGIAHRILAPPLQPKAVARLFPEMRDLTGELVDQWKATSLPITPFDGLGRVVCEMIHKTLFGERLNGLTGPEPPVIQAIKDFMAECVRRPTRPRILNWLLHDGTQQADVSTMREYAADALTWGKEHPEERAEFMTILIEGKDPETGRGLTDKQAIDNMVSKQIAASTAPCLLTAVLVYLLKKPETLAKARQEIDSVVGEGEFEHVHLARLKYMQGVVRESLRMAAPAPAFNVEANPSNDASPILLAGGKYEIPHDQPMIVVVSEVNHDPTVFEDPYEFRPERMMGEAFEKLPPGAKKWFGSGKRECLGIHYAMQMCTVILVRLVRELDMEMADPSYVPDMLGFLNVHPVGFTMKARPRGM
ncbi:cytochrome P450 [Ophiocordyceps camponoti-floridani]|uniref:Cytochrome P450 n=1 Tax=Ophiocordyceps camponoti-floridani TaxID=2030778 RepID=A0A8H4QE47_9HYPO|nr:cytochrome P450 [Ophiocordyceps camponoti-floridani]